MAIATRKHVYRAGGREVEALVAWNASQRGPRPGVLVSHAWRGRSGFEDGKAELLASFGYLGFALDLYGKGVFGNSTAENQRLMQPFMEDRGLLGARMQQALGELKALPEVDAERTAAIGYCFGGLCVLDLARSGAELRAAVSFHGLLRPPTPSPAQRVRARILVLHGWDDPMAPPEQVLALADELTRAGADWQIHAYGHTVHAFTNPLADDPEKGLKYNAAADRRARESMQGFLHETLA